MLVQVHYYWVAHKVWCRQECSVPKRAETIRQCVCR